MNAIIALNPRQMAEAQGQTVTWTARKLAEAQRELSEAEAVFASLNAARLNTLPATRMQRAAARRVRFYTKIKAALELGYYIIPPFDLQLFAIRTDRQKPYADKDESRWTREQNPRDLAIGAGEWKSPVAHRFEVGKKVEPIPYPSNDGPKTREVKVYANLEFGDLEIPVRALKPQVIEATGRALQEKVFDALGMAPTYRSADPIIAGRILHPDGKQALTFFVAWWLDESDL